MKAIIYISGVIGEDTTMVDVLRQYKAYDTPTEVEVHINSVGGSVREGDAIYNFLVGLDLPVTTVTARAFSIAAKIFCAGSVRKVEDVEGVIMAHLPWTMVNGDAEKLEMVAAKLREVEDDFAKFYSEFLGVTKEVALDLLANETYLSGADAVALNYATELMPSVKALATNNNYINNQKNEKMTKNEKKALSFFARLFGSIRAELSVQDATGTEVVFPDLEVGDTPSVGDAATVDGATISDGEYKLPSLGDYTYKFEGGKIAEILEVEPVEVEDPEVEPMAKIKAEKVQQISVWTMEVVDGEYNVGDTVHAIDWEGNEQPVGAGEYRLEDGRSIVTDASGVIVSVKEAKSEPTVEVETTEQIEARVRAEVADELAAKEVEIQALKSAISSQEQTPTIVAAQSSVKRSGNYLAYAGVKK